MSQSGAYFSPKKNKSKRFCSVFGCNSTEKRDETIRFHHYPKKGDSFVEVENKFGIFEKIDRHQAWKKILRMGKNVTQWTVVCSKHFKKEDYVLPGMCNIQFFQYFT